VLNSNNKTKDQNMATFIDLDSVWRDRDSYPNENNYELGPKKIESWFKSARSVRAYPQNPNLQPLEFATTVNITYMTVPYSETVSEFPRLYVNFRSQKYKDIHLINTIEGRHMDAKFICVFDKIQSDRNGNPMWIHYKCDMEQTMRFERGEPIVLQITTRDGSVLPQLDTPPDQPPDPLKQNLITFEVTPYIRDGDYDNHLVQPLQM
jgi:hypothetical protein